MLHSSPNAVIPTGLEKIADGRDLITTKEFAKAINFQPSSVRKSLCINGHCLGIVPKKLGSRLAWPVRDIARVLTEGVADAA